MSSLLPRTPHITPADFIDRHLGPHAPVVVTGEVTQWPAFTTWTWDHLTGLLGGFEADVYDDWFTPTATAVFADFVAATIGIDGAREQRYLRWFSRCGPGDGRWADDVFAAVRADWRRPAFMPASGYIVPPVACAARIDPTVDPMPYRALFVSGRGARTRLHLDPWGSSAILCQVVGDKHVSMWPPAQHDVMLALSEQGRAGDSCGVPPGYDDMLHAGEALYIPAGWWHEVDTVTDSVSVTWNFVHATDGEAFLRHVRAVPDDPELDVAAYFLAASPGAAPRGADLAALAQASVDALAAAPGPVTAVGGRAHAGRETS